MKSFEVLHETIEPTGAKQVAFDLRVSSSLVYKWCTAPGDDATPAGARNPLDRVLQICESTRSRRPVEWLCGRLGGYLVESPDAEPEEQLAITRAEKPRAEAGIQRDTAQISLEKARIEAETQRTLAEAEAYQKEVILKADNALAQKLDAEIQIHGLWADALARRQVPANVFGGGSAGTPVGSDTEARTFMQLLTLDAAKRLSYERSVEPARVATSPRATRTRASGSTPARLPHPKPAP